ncbi:MAG TPA: tRNA epoxyqueuosine(34) reductase QueG [Candidatus Eisenbacteria bacterium]|jgi:epoxyqueuosine reductase|nr:tRNA epoxyqueuosine(34) reductase QueG [Candidatus Eisenbacteria bacterium]
MEPAALNASDTQWICDRAQHVGFELCGVAAAEKFPELERFPEWLKRGYAGEMKYLSDPRRLDPQSAMSNVRSLIVCALNYNSALPYSTDRTVLDGEESPRGWISRYAWGGDYHEVLWTKLNALVAEMKAHFASSEPFEARAYADTGPIHERAAAKYAGLGWLGKNTLLINQGAGSWLFLGAILTTLRFAPTLGPDKMPPPDRCGTCRACIDACPTQAIVEPYLLDATRCISYLTIELRGSIAEDLREPMGHHVFGCDICQDVCPWNRKSARTDAPEFEPRKLSKDTGNPEESSLFRPDLLQLANLSEAEFREDFRDSPIKRAKWRGLLRNACIALGNSGLRPGNSVYPEALSSLLKLSESRDVVISESARWALSRIQPGDNRFGGG